MVIEWGDFTNVQLEDGLTAWGDYIDIAKFLHYHLLFPEEYVKRRIKIYHEHDILVQPGGLPFELAALQKKEEKFLEDCKRLGFDIIEVSDSIAPWTKEQKAQYVEQAKGYGFEVYGEAGKLLVEGDRTRTAENVSDVNSHRSRATLDVKATAEEIKSVLDAGSSRCYLESCTITRQALGDFVENKAGQRAILELAKQLGEYAARVMWEVSSVPWFETRLLQWAWFRDNFGPDINIANCRVYDVPVLEAARRGMSLGRPPFPLMMSLGRGEEWPKSYIDLYR